MRFACSFTVLFTTIVILAFPFAALAQGAVTPDTTTIALARVTAISNQSSEQIPDTGVSAPTQTLTAIILNGQEAGDTVTFSNDYTQLTVGEEFYISHTTNALDGTDYYSVSDPYRLNVLAGVAGLFILLIVLFGGLQGIRGFISLCGSFLLIFYVLLPGILHGYSPVWLSIGVSSLIIVFGSYVTHGFNRTTTTAVLGMLITVLITGAFAFWVVHAAQLSGYNTEEDVYLNFDSNGTIDLVGLLFGGIMIGLLGVLYDIAIGQAIAVEELFAAGAHMTRKHVFRRSLRIGREHIGALVNTLAIAYAGAALPLLLLVQSASYGVFYAINNEIFATEIVRILIGSIGLVLAVPITTLIATYMLDGKVAPDASESHGHHH